MPCLHHDDNQSCNLRAARIEQDGFWQKTWKIALSSACRPHPLDIQYGSDIGLRIRDRNLQLCPTGLGSGIDKDRPDYTVY